MQTTPRDAMAGPRRELDRTDRDDLRYSLRISVWVRWFLLTAWLLQFNYRPNFADPAYVPTTLLAVSVLALNGYVHYRIRSHRTVTRRWALALSVMDGAMITAGIAICSMPTTPSVPGSWFLLSHSRAHLRLQGADVDAQQHHFLRANWRQLSAGGRDHAVSRDFPFEEVPVVHSMHKHVSESFKQGRGCPVIQH